jgi:hypothetical protein
MGDRERKLWETGKKPWKTGGKTRGKVMAGNDEIIKCHGMAAVLPVLP